MTIFTVSLLERGLARLTHPEVTPDAEGLQAWKLVVPQTRKDGLYLPLIERMCVKASDNIAVLLEQTYSDLTRACDGGFTAECIS